MHKSYSPGRHFTLLLHELPARLLGSFRQCLLHCFRSQTCDVRRQRDVRAVRLYPTAQSRAAVRKHINIKGPDDGVSAAQESEFEFGTYFLAGRSTHEPPRRQSRPAVDLAVRCVAALAIALYGVDLQRQAQQAGTRGQAEPCRLQTS